MDCDPDMERDMKCLLCQDFLSNPTTIPCGHNFCIECIEKCWDMEVYSGTYTCPQCKRTVDRRPSLSRNMALANMVHNFLQPRKLPRDDSVIQHDIVDKKETLKKLTQEKEENLEKLRAAMVFVEQSAEAAVQDSEGILSELLHTLEETRSRLREHIQERRKALLSRAEKEEMQLIGQISVLKRKDAELDSLVPPVQNNVQSLQKLQDINRVLQQGKQPPVVISNSQFFPFVKTDLNNLKNTVVGIWNDASESICQKVNDVQIFQSPQVKPRNKPDIKKVRSPEVLKDDIIKEQGSTIPTKEPQVPVAASKPKPALRRSQSIKPNIYSFDKKSADSSLTRVDLLQYACVLSLNPATAHPILRLTEDKKVTQVDKGQRRPCPTKAFDHWEQVLCVEGLIGGLCYWEVEWRGKDVFIGVALEGMRRKGKGLECGLGRNASSWCLHCSNDKFTAWHNNNEYEITTKIFSPRTGVFLDQLIGTLTFYSVSLNAFTALHTFKAQNLRGLLFPCFGVGKESSVKLCLLEKT